MVRFPACAPLVLLVVAGVCMNVTSPAAGAGQRRAAPPWWWRTRRRGVPRPGMPGGQGREEPVDAHPAQAEERKLTAHDCRRPSPSAPACRCQEQLVWVDLKTKRYHLTGCSLVGLPRAQMRLDQAMANYKPCNACKPPRRSKLPQRRTTRSARCDVRPPRLSMFRTVACVACDPVCSTVMTADAPPAPIVYTLRFPAPHTHYVEVEARVPTGGRPTIELMMAGLDAGLVPRARVRAQRRARRRAATPGGAVAAGHARRPRTAGRSRPAAPRRVVVRYGVYCREMSVRTNWVEAAVRPAQRRGDVRHARRTGPRGRTR